MVIKTCECTWGIQWRGTKHAGNTSVLVQYVKICLFELNLVELAIFQTLHVLWGPLISDRIRLFLVEYLSLCLAWSNIQSKRTTIMTQYYYSYYIYPFNEKLAFL